MLLRLLVFLGCKGFFAFLSFFLPVFLYHTSYPLRSMGSKVTIYLSEPTKAILNDMEGETASSKVRVALESLNRDAATLAHFQEQMVSALRRQLKRRDDLLIRIERKAKLTPKSLNDIRDILEGF